MLFHPMRLGKLISVPDAQLLTQPKGNPMSQVQLINAADTTTDRKALLDQVKQAFGTIPNMFKATANSPAALKSMWGAFGALGKGVIGTKLGEKIAVAVANYNQCEYCLAAHTYIGQGAGIALEELHAAQSGHSTDPKTAAALSFALKLVNLRGQVSRADTQALREAGFNDEEIVEIIAHVALNLFTNYINIALDVPVDFPKIQLENAA